ncbi:MAG: sigma-70 family RNA polymerase sigma factor [Rhodanobacteraceae bacterium]
MSHSSFAIDIDADQVTRFRAGDLAAFEHVYRTWSQPVFTLALRITGNRERAQEVLQDSMLKAFQRARQFQGDAPFWGWLRRIAVNECLMHLRREKTRQHESINVEPGDPGMAEPWRHADAATLETALQKLPETARAVLWLYHVEGYTHPEIAVKFGRSVSFSKSQLARGTQRLRQIMHDKEEAVPCLTRTTTA